MRVNGYGADYKNYDIEQIQSDRAGKAEKTPAAEKENGFPPIKDEYVNSEESGRNLKGLYRMGQDENGNPKVLYEDPEKKAKGKDAGRGEKAADGVEECTGSTDQVDREIEKLKEQKRQLEQQMKAAGGDEKKLKELERKLARVETELMRKDNDTYRKQHMAIS